MGIEAAAPCPLGLHASLPQRPPRAAPVTASVAATAIARCIATFGAAVIATCMVGNAMALDHVVLTRDGGRRPLAGRVIAEAQDGGIVLQTADGVLWPLQPEDFVERRADDAPFQPLSREEITTRLLADLPSGFRVHSTANYQIGRAHV